MSDLARQVHALAETLRLNCQYQRPFDAGGLDRDWSPEILQCVKQNARKFKEYGAPPRELCAVCKVADELDALVRAAIPPAPLDELADRLNRAIDPDRGVDIEAIDKVIAELHQGAGGVRSAGPPQPPIQSNCAVSGSADLQPSVPNGGDSGQFQVGGAAGPQVPPPHGYDSEKHCCSVCDAKKCCHVCGTPTLFACSDCRIDFGVSVYVCAKPECRAAHEAKCRFAARGDAARVPTSQLSDWANRLNRALDPDNGVSVDVIDAVIAELNRAARVPPATPPRLSVEDIDQIVEGIEHFCIGPNPDDELDAIWRPYINKLTDLRADLMLAAPATPQEK